MLHRCFHFLCCEKDVFDFFLLMFGGPGELAGAAWTRLDVRELKVVRRERVFRKAVSAAVGG